MEDSGKRGFCIVVFASDKGGTDVQMLENDANGNVGRGGIWVMSREVRGVGVVLNLFMKVGEFSLSERLI